MTERGYSLRCFRMNQATAVGALHSITERENGMITMTSAAEAKIRELMQEEKDTIGLRVYVKGGGCHGYQYGMAFESNIGEDDTVVDKGDVKVIMDSQSAPLLAGCEVDFQDTVQGSGFAIKNPQAKTTCGCGSSFSA
jgi:iron-sulfur cluster insertion protein